MKNLAVHEAFVTASRRINCRRCANLCAKNLIIAEVLCSPSLSYLWISSCCGWLMSSPIYHYFSHIFCVKYGWISPCSHYFSRTKDAIQNEQFGARKYSMTKRPLWSYWISPCSHYYSRTKDAIQKSKLERESMIKRPLWSYWIAYTKTSSCWKSKIIFLPLNWLNLMTKKTESTFQNTINCIFNFHWNSFKL